MGHAPDSTDLFKYEYKVMAEDYAAGCQIEFPLNEVAEDVYKMRLEKKDEFSRDYRPREAKYFVKHRLFVEREMSLNSIQTTQKWLTFRHEKFWDFFTAHFLESASPNVRNKHFADFRFRGAYLRLAHILKIDEAEKLYSAIAKYARKTQDRSISDDFFLIIDQRNGKTPDTSSEACGLAVEVPLMPSSA